MSARGHGTGPVAGEVYRNIPLRGTGQEQQGQKRVVVVQTDEAAGLSTRLCVPTSASAAPAPWRIEVGVDGEETLALVEQLRAISVSQLTPDRLLGRIGYTDLQAIRTLAARLLGFIF